MDARILVFVLDLVAAELDVDLALRLADAAGEAESLYNKLEHAILPLYYGKPDAYAAIRRSAISLNGSYFHTQRMVLQYVRNSYLGVEP